MNVELNISDVCCSECFRNEKELQPTISSPSQTIDLLCDYRLNVIQITSTYITVMIQTTNFVVIRDVYPSFPLIISLPCKCCTHILTIGVIL